MNDGSDASAPETQPQDKIKAAIHQWEWSRGNTESVLRTKTDTVS